MIKRHLTIKHLLFLALAFNFNLGYSQTRKRTHKKVKAVAKPTFSAKDYEKLNDSIPALIMKRENAKIGFVNQKGKWIVKPEYNFGNFFFEDCHLQNSPNSKIRKYGSANYASVTIGEKDFRIDKTGKRVYQFKNEDLGECTSTYQAPKFYGYNYRGFYGVVNDKNFSTPEQSQTFTIYPQYTELFILESKDKNNPMIIAESIGLFGVIDIRNNIIIPFEYENIKKNFSWRIANLFEVTKDGTNYYFIDANNKEY